MESHHRSLHHSHLCSSSFVIKPTSHLRSKVLQKSKIIQHRQNIKHKHNPQVHIFIKYSPQMHTCGLLSLFVINRGWWILSGGGEGHPQSVLTLSAAGVSSDLGFRSYLETDCVYKSHKHSPHRGLEVRLVQAVQEGPGFQGSPAHHLCHGALDFPKDRNREMQWMTKRTEFPHSHTAAE